MDILKNSMRVQRDLWWKIVNGKYKLYIFLILKIQHFFFCNKNTKTKLYIIFLARRNV